MGQLAERGHELTHEPGDGKTMWLTTAGAIVINPYLYPKLTYSLDDLAAVSLVVNTPEMRFHVREHASTLAPVLPADTSASAAPSATRRAATAMDASGRASSASCGLSSMRTNEPA